jgi:hypothetical protein
MDRVGTTQLALPLCAFLGKYMTAMRMVALKTTRSGFLETFRRATISFQLWHRALRFNL